MKKFDKIQMQNALVLEEREMKSICGGSGGAGESYMAYCREKGFSYICTCSNSIGEWCSNSDASGNSSYCASGSANCNKV